MKRSLNSRFSSFIRVLAVVSLFSTLLCAACATSSTSGRGSRLESGLVQFVVTPKEASPVEIYVDEAYYGELSRWRDGVVKMPAGGRRVEIRAKGYYPQRFDFSVEPHAQLTFSIELEQDWDPSESDLDSLPF